MIAAIVVWVYIMALSWVYGGACVRLLEKLMLGTAVEARRLPPSLTWLLGLVLLGVLGAFFSLWMALGLWVNLILIAGAVLLLFLRLGLRFPIEYARSTFSGGRLPLAGILLLLVALVTGALVLNGVSFTPKNPDTGIYHAQAIHWIESYPALPGLGNLNNRFAYNSIWFVETALFSFAFLKLQSFHVLTGVLVLLACARFLSALGELRRGRVSLAAMLRLLLLPAFFYTLAGDISSPATDLPAALMTWLVLCEWVEIGETGGRHTEAARLLRAGLLTLFSVFCVMIKLSAIPLLIPVVVWGLRLMAQRRWRPLLAAAGIGLLFLLPWLGRNVVLSGYLVYPLYEVDLFNVDWKIPRETAYWEREVIGTWAKDPGVDLQIIRKRSLSTWVTLWYGDLTANRQAILWMALASPLLMLASFVPLRGLRMARARLQAAWLPLLAAWLGMAYWFFSAPDFRFGYGSLVFAALSLPAFALVVIFEWTAPARREPLMAGLALGLFLFHGFTLARSIDLPTLGGRWLMPGDYFNLPSKPCDLANTSMWCPDVYVECYYEPFPCLAVPKPEVGLRGKTIESGFKIFPR